MDCLSLSVSLSHKHIYCGLIGALLRWTGAPLTQDYHCVGASEICSAVYTVGL